MPSEKTKNNISHVFFKTLRMLSSRKKFQFYILFFMMIIFAGLETLTLAGIALYVSAVSYPDKILQSSYIEKIRYFAGSDFLATPKDLIIAFSLVVLILVVTKNLFKGFTIYANARFSNYVGGFVGGKILGGLLSIPYEWHLNRNSADLILAVGWRTYFISLMQASFKMATNFLMIVFMLTTLILVQPKMSLLVLGVLGSFCVLIFKSSRKFVDQYSLKSKKYEEMLHRDVTKALHGVKDVKIFGREEAFLKDFEKGVYVFARSQSVLEVVTNGPVWILEAVGFFTLISVVYVMFFFMDMPSATVIGIIALLALTAWKVLPAVAGILGFVTNTRRLIPYLQQVFDYLSDIQKQVGPTNCGIAEKLNFNNCINIDDVLFSYKGRKSYTLGAINLNIKKGSTVGVIGTSGAGKSTLVNILIGLLFPQEGKIEIDDKKLDVSTRPVWTRKIGYVPQSPYIHDGTLAENVAFGLKSEEIDREHVLACCERAAIQDFMHELSNGIDTHIGERGVRLSGGQQQRVAIARALYHNPVVIIFDEATSSLDARSEKAIQNTVYSFKGKLTLIIIAHRLTTVEECDMIVWLDNGKIRSTGTPEEILPLYSQYMETETLRKEIAAE